MPEAATAQTGAGNKVDIAAVGGGEADVGAVDTKTNGATNGKAAATLAETVGDEAGDKGAVAATDAPDWRDLLAGKDEKFRKQLDRFASLEGVGKKFRSLEQRFSSGEYQRGRPEGATPEEIAAWRKEAGLPDKADGYLENLALPNGVVLGEADKPVALGFAEAALDADISPAAYSKLVAKYYDMQDKVAAQRQDADHQFLQSSEDELRTEWGNDFRRNRTAINNLVAGWPEDVRALMAARDANGNMIGNHPGFLRMLANMAFELNPAATLVPAGVSNPGRSVDSRLEEIRKMRRDDPDKWDSDHALQAEERELLNAKMKMQARQGASAA